MRADLLDDIERLNPNNFWFRAKQEYLQLLIKQPGATILDVGCGTGTNLASFVSRGYTVVGYDNNERALQFAAEKGYRVHCHDVQEEVPVEAKHLCRYIVALDVLEHLAAPVRALMHLRSLADSDTELIVTVPAFPVLLSAWDTDMGHVKRYTRRALCRELTAAGWRVKRAGYIHFLPLVPAAVLRKLILPLLKLAGRCERERFCNPGTTLNKIIYCLYQPEFACYRAGFDLPLGLSVLATAVLSDDAAERQGKDND